MQRAKDLLTARIGGPNSLDELAQECNLSMSHFIRAFKASVGMSPHQWLLRQRMERAKHLLEFTTLPVVDIALECGFSHRVPFSSAFRRAEGMSPGEWRRKKVWLADKTDLLVGSSL